MAAGTLPAPGSKYGPCLHTCQHTDCAVTNAMLAATCLYCEQPILADVLFYQIGDPPPTQADRRRTSQWDGKLAHAACHEEMIESLRATTGELKRDEQQMLRTQVSAIITRLEVVS